ncbi:MAG TPA: DinB family protein [Candidatus Eisenbacteria bacterium]|nr:DinB family protein [Candidatus Eisenbacteria bacterium]
MTADVALEKARSEVLEFLGETFDRVRGIYLDRGTSFFETLADVTACEASRRASPDTASIAAHVRHCIYYLEVLQRSLRGEALGALDWRSIWTNDRPVDEREWNELRERLRTEASAVEALAKDDAAWMREDALGGFMAVIVHTAYHLGAVRQALRVIRTERV